jgi:acyl-CoA thioester hydrolase
MTVRFSDVDIMGHVNNARYLSYFEQARVAYYKKLKALDLRRMNAHTAFGFIVAEIGIKFHAPAYIDETLVLSIRIAELRTRAFRMEYEIREKKTKRLIVTGYSVQVMYNYRKKRTFPIPSSLRRKIKALERM